MGDAKSGPVRLSFNPQLRVEFRGATVTSDAGLLLPRELDERLGLGELIDRHLTDPRTGHNRQFPLPDLFRQSIYSRLAGYNGHSESVCYQATCVASRVIANPIGGARVTRSGGETGGVSEPRDRGDDTHGQSCA